MGRKIALTLLIVVGAAWVWSLVAGEHGSAPGHALAANAKVAPDLAIQTADGEKRLSDLKGKVVLVDFWATWCPPCRESIPHVEGLYKRYHNQGFEVLGASLDNSDAVIPPFAGQMGITYPVGRPVSPESVQDYGAESIPTMVLVDKKGNARWRAVGFGDNTEKDLQTQVEALLKE